MWGEAYAKLVERINNSTDIGEDRKLLLEYDKNRKIEGISVSTRITLLRNLLYLRRMLGKPFKDATKEDIQNLISSLIEKGVYGSTISKFKSDLKHFYKWLMGNNEEYPEIVKWIKTTTRTNSLPRDNLLTEEEIKELLQVCLHPRDRAMVLMLAESGLRVGELLSLKVGHVRFDQYGAIVTVRGKTGDRAVRLIASAPSLSSWMESHPDRENPHAPLFVQIGPKNKNQPLTYFSAYATLKRLAKRAGIKKEIHPHVFRHTAATRLARLLTEAEMKQYLGWVQSSKMAGIYVHLASRDVDKTLLRIHGLLSEDEDQERKMVAIKCPRCKQRNSFGAKFCSYCGLPLDIRSAMEVDEKRKRSEKILNILSKDPEFVEFMRRKVNELMEEGLLEGL
jgi:site-specific recombinase XerD/phage FluMu protein Com